VEPIPKKPICALLQPNVIFRPPRVGAYQAWLVLRGVDQTGHRFEERVVLVGEAPRNALGLIDDQAIASYGNLTDDQAIDVMNAAWHVMTRRSGASQLVAQAPSSYRGVLESLALAAGGTHPTKQEKRSPDERLQRLEAATAHLQPIAHRVAGVLEDDSWVDSH